MSIILSQALPAVPESAAAVESPTPATSQPTEAKQLLDQLDLDTTITDTPWTGWGMLLLAIFLGVVGGKLLHTAAKGLGKRLRNRGWDSYATIAESAAGPIYLWAITVGIAIGLAPIALAPAVRGFSNGVL